MYAIPDNIHPEILEVNYQMIEVRNLNGEQLNGSENFALAF